MHVDLHKSTGGSCPVVNWRYALFIDHHTSVPIGGRSIIIQSICRKAQSSLLIHKDFSGREEALNVRR